MTQPPYVRADFMLAMSTGRALLGGPGMESELTAQNAVLRHGMRVLLWDDDLNESGERVLQVFEATVFLDAERKCWVAVF
jgi:hypothetical protein